MNPFFLTTNMALRCTFACSAMILGLPIALLAQKTTLWRFEGNATARLLGEAVAAADFNHDGTTDIALSRWNTASSPNRYEFVLLSGATASSFFSIQVPALVSPGTTPRIAIGDMFGRNRYDLYIAWNTSPSRPDSQLSRYADLGNGSFAWVDSAWNSPYRFFYDIATCRFDANTSSDMFFSSTNLPTNIGLFTERWNPGPQYLAQNSLSAGASVACGDVNNDNLDDLFIGYRDYVRPSVNVRSGAVSIYSAPMGALIQHLEGENDMDAFGEDIAVGDVNQDGVKDLLVGAPGHDANGLTDVGAIYLYSGANRSLLQKAVGTFNGGRLGQRVAVSHGVVPAFMAATYVDRASNTGVVNTYFAVTGQRKDTVFGNSGDATFGSHVAYSRGFSFGGTNAELIVSAPGTANSASGYVIVYAESAVVQLGTGCGPNPTTLAVSSLRQNHPVVVFGQTVPNALVATFASFAPLTGVLQHATCPIYLNPPPAFHPLGYASADGSGRWWLLLPNNPLPVGVEVAIQAIVVHPTTSTLGFSPGVRFQTQP